MSEPTARQIAEQIAWHATGQCGCAFLTECEAMREHIVAESVATLTADLVQARQERDAAQKAMSYTSEQAHLEWTRANKAEGELAEALQARDAALKGCEALFAQVNPPCPSCVSEYGKADPACTFCHGTGVCPSVAQSAARTALLEAAEDITKMANSKVVGTNCPRHPPGFAAWLRSRAGAAK